MSESNSLRPDGDAQSQPSWECSWCGRDDANCTCGSELRHVGWLEVNGAAIEIVVGWDGMDE